MKKQMESKAKGKAIGFKPTLKMREYLDATYRKTGMTISQQIRNAVYHLMQDNGVATR